MLDPYIRHDRRTVRYNQQHHTTPAQQLGVGLMAILAHFALMAGTASAALLTLSNFQGLTTAVPVQCLYAYNMPIQRCTPDDFSVGASCSHISRSAETNTANTSTIIKSRRTAPDIFNIVNVDYPITNNIIIIRPSRSDYKYANKRNIIIHFDRVSG
ncbi:hypothetical protein A9Z42_0020050 [Trichoderma parareesei]|uniref:Uncharacterized protein n=1 Tax=Trichoderma parareesei TaxID=858221 RepID=A0A2H2ZE61_TRIPA|nr:hypothetical protein A9Z42_0020050 [Trichoderma parareesei]